MTREMTVPVRMGLQQGAWVLVRVQSQPAPESDGTQDIWCLGAIATLWLGMMRVWAHEMRGEKDKADACARQDGNVH